MMSMEEMTFAIELSQWWSVEWRQLPDYVQVVLIKATEGDYAVDPSLGQHVEEALAAGKTVGLYHCYRTSIDGNKVPGVDQAENFIEHTRPFWDDVDLRANRFGRGPFNHSRGAYDNPRRGSESEELHAFHGALHESEWGAFDLLHTSTPSWFEMKMENAANLWQGPAWIRDESLIDGLWLDWRPYRRPRGHGNLEKFLPGSFSPRLPRPFREYWAWQFSGDFYLPGLYNAPGTLIKHAEMSVIPYPVEVVRQMLTAISRDEGDRAKLDKISEKEKEGE